MTKMFVSRRSIFAGVVVLLQVVALPVQGQTVSLSIPDRFWVVNMVPQNRSGETSRDAEPNLAVNPANIAQIAGSAFTPSNGFCAANAAPIFVSADTGKGWALNCIVPNPGTRRPWRSMVMVRRTTGLNVMFIPSTAR